MPAVPMFVALQPDPILTQFLLDAKATTRRIAGDQLYLDDPPHLTLYLAAFESPELIMSLAEGLAKEIGPVSGQVVGWHVFEADVLTGRNTLVCEIDPDDKILLREVQSRVIDQLAPVRDRDATLRRFEGKLDNLSLERREAIDRCGFPFVGTDWQPHFSVASILPVDWPTVWEALRTRPPVMPFACPEIKVYRLDGVTPSLVETVAVR